MAVLVAAATASADKFMTASTPTVPFTYKCHLHALCMLLAELAAHSLQLRTVDGR